MAELHIQRSHTLGLAQARVIATQWAEQAQTDFGMSCTYAQGEQADQLAFARPGFKGTLQVDAGQFEIRAQLGFLFDAFRPRIEAEMNRKLDALLVPATAT